MRTAMKTPARGAARAGPPARGHHRCPGCPGCRGCRGASVRARAAKQDGDASLDVEIGSAESPAIPGFGKEDNRVARANRDNSKELSTKDVMSGPFSKTGVIDSSGAVGKGLGVYKYSNKYRGNIDTYAPIYNPEAFGDDAITAMSNADFIKFIIPFAIAFLSLPAAIALKGYGLL